MERRLRPCWTFLRFFFYHSYLTFPILPHLHCIATPPTHIIISLRKYRLSWTGIVASPPLFVHPPGWIPCIYFFFTSSLRASLAVDPPAMLAHVLADLCPSASMLYAVK